MDCTKARFKNLKLEEYHAKIDEILQNHTDQAKISTILAELKEDYTTVSAETEKAKETAKKFTEDNEKLRQANMSLFLKIGETKVEETHIKKDEETKMSFDDLFDENGNLK